MIAIYLYAFTNKLLRLWLHWKLQGILNFGRQIFVP